MMTGGFFALAVFGLGALSVATDADIISVQGLGQAPGVIGMILAIAAFAGILWLAVRIARPRFRSVWTIAVTTALVHLLGVVIVATIVSGEFVTALAVMGDLITGGASLVVFAAAAVASCVGVMMRYAKSSHPRWPWERDEPEEK